MYLVCFSRVNLNKLKNFLSQNLQVSLHFTIHYWRMETKALLDGESSDKSDSEEGFYFTKSPVMERLRKTSSSSLLNSPAPPIMERLRKASSSSLLNSPTQNVRPKTPILHHRTFDEELIGFVYSIFCSTLSEKKMSGV